MAKRVQKAVRKKPTARPDDERRRLERRYLARALREQKEIQQLTRKLRRAIRVTQDDIVNLAGWLAGPEYRIVRKDVDSMLREESDAPATV